MKRATVVLLLESLSIMTLTFINLNMWNDLGVTQTLFGTTAYSVFVLSVFGCVYIGGVVGKIIFTIGDNVVSLFKK